MDIRKDLASSTHVEYNGNLVEMSRLEIFDPSKFTNLKAITFSISRYFILNTFFTYSDIEIIVGISNTTVQSIAYNALCDMSDYHYQHNSTIQPFHRKFIQASCRIPSKGVIHSKLYLLSNPETQIYRTVIGSANLSKAAFDNESHQFENVVITDGFDVYQKQLLYYKSIRDNTMPYVDHETKIKLKRLGYFK